MNEIKGFNGEYRFLSNFYIVPVPYEGGGISDSRGCISGS